MDIATSWIQNKKVLIWLSVTAASACNAPPPQAVLIPPVPDGAILPTSKGRGIFETTEMLNLMETEFFEPVGSAQGPGNTAIVPSFAAI